MDRAESGIDVPTRASAPWVDLSLPVSEEIPRWQVRFDTVREGIAHQTTTITLPIHCGTHLDAPLHYIPGGVSVDQFPLELAVTEAHIVDLTDAAPNQRLEVRDVGPRFPVGHPETILLRTDWPERAWRTPGFWSDSPFICEDLALWLAQKGIRVIGYDFPQEEPIKRIASGNACAADFVVHQVFLSRGIWQIEYLANLHRLESSRATLLLCPLPLVGVEGSPIRVLGRGHS